MTAERHAIARATTDALTATAAANSIEAPQTLLDALSSEGRVMGDRHFEIKLTPRATSILRAIHGDGNFSFPTSVEQLPAVGDEIQFAEHVSPVVLIVIGRKFHISDSQDQTLRVELLLDAPEGAAPKRVEHESREGSARRG